MMRRRKRLRSILIIEQIILNPRLKYIKSSPLVVTVVIYQPRLLSCHITEAFLIKAVELRVVCDVFKVPFEHFY